MNGAISTWLYDPWIKLYALGTEKKRRKDFIRFAGIRDGMLVLDVGCGTGTLTNMAAQYTKDGHVIGVEPSKRMLDRAGKKARNAGLETEFWLACAESLPFKDGSFDVVLVSFVFHHLSHDVKKRALDEVYRVLMPGGFLAYMDYGMPTNVFGRVIASIVILEGFGDSFRDHFEGRMPELIRNAGFVDLVIQERRFYVFQIVRAQKPVT